MTKITNTSSISSKQQSHNSYNIVNVKSLILKCAAVIRVICQKSATY